MNATPETMMDIKTLPIAFLVLVICMKQSVSKIFCA